MKDQADARAGDVAIAGRATGARALVRGGSWLAIGQFAAQGYFLVAAFIAAKLVGPETFALVTLQLVVINALLLVADGGFATALIREQRPLRPALGLAGVAFGLVGGALGLALWLLQSSDWILGAAPILILAPFVAYALVQQASLVADLRFKVAGVVQAAAAAIALVVAVATLAGGLYAAFLPASFAAYLAVLLLFQAATYGLSRLSTGVVPWRVLRFSGGVLGSSALNFAGANVDYLIVGLTLGRGSLGQYALGYTISMAFQTRVMSIVNRAAYPIMSKMTNELRLEWYGSLLAISVAVAAPVYAGLFIAVPNLIVVALGPQWSEAVDVTRALLGAGLAFTLGTTVGALLLAAGRSEVLVAFGIIRILGISAAVALSASAGLVAVSLAVAVYAWIAVPLTILIAAALSGGTERVVRSAARWGRQAVPAFALSAVGAVLPNQWMGLAVAAAGLALGLRMVAHWIDSDRWEGDPPVGPSYVAGAL